MSLFDRVISQHIDIYGKTRILNFDNLSLIISPIPVLYVKEVSSTEIKTATLSDAYKFVAEFNLRVVEEDKDPRKHNITGDKSSGHEIIGLAVKSSEENPPFMKGYIPIHITPHNSISDSPTSLLDIARHNLKTAEYLKAYSIYLWAQDPSKFGNDSFIVIKDYKYDSDQFGSKIFEGSIFLEDKKIIVPNKEIIKRLVSYVKVASLNDSTLEIAKKNDVNINPSLLYTSPKDFKQYPKQYIFFGRKSLLEWNRKNNLKGFNKDLDIQILSYVNPSLTEPYYYRNQNIYDGNIVIIQNTDLGDLPSALLVSQEWERDNPDGGMRKNLGYYVSKLNLYYKFPNLERLAFEVFTEKGMTHQSDVEMATNEKRLSVFGYEDGTYAAILRYVPSIYS